MTDAIEGLDTFQLLDDREHSRVLTKVSYADTELKAEPSGPKVTEEEYQEYVVLTELALDSMELHG